MNMLSDSIVPLIQDLMAHSCKASLLACAVVLICFLPRRWLSPAWRHGLWCAVFLRLVLPDIQVPGWRWNVSSAIRPALRVSTAVIQDLPASPQEFVHLEAIGPAVTAGAWPSASAGKPIVASNSPESDHAWDRLDRWHMLALIWMSGTGVWWAALCVSWCRFNRRVLKKSSQPSAQAQSLLATCMTEAGVRGAVHLRYSEHIASPAVCGMVRKVILLPCSLESTISSSELRLLLLHELGHVKRHDAVTQVLATVLLGLHWWNPFLWLAWRQLTHEAEAATDAWVLQRTGANSAPSYGAMLVTLASRFCASGLALLLVPSLIRATGQGRRLRQRIIAIVDHRPARRWAGLLGFTTIVLLMISGFSQEAPVPKAASEVKSTAGKALPIITLKVTAANTGKPLTVDAIESGMVRRTSPEDYPALWFSGRKGGNFTMDAKAGEYRFEMSEQAQSQLVKFRVKCPGYAPTMTATVDPQASTTLSVTLQERSPAAITVVNDDGTPAAKAVVFVAWNPRFRAATDSPEGRKYSRLGQVSVMRRSLEFEGLTGDDGRCVLPPCADEAAVVIASKSAFATLSYADLLQESTIKLQSFSSDSERQLVARSLPPPPGGPAEGGLQIQVMFDDKPLASKWACILTAGDNPDDLAGPYKSFLTNGAARHHFLPGNRNLQVGWRTPEGVNWFSRVINAEIESRKTTEVVATLQPGLRLAGRVADEMPRPIKEARILVFVSAQAEGPLGKLTWSDTADIREDGTFEFRSLPWGHMRFLVLADGWISPMKPEPDGGRNTLWSAGVISESRDGLVIPMRPAATCEVTVLDANGTPAPKAVITKSIGFSTDAANGRVLFFDAVRPFMLASPETLEQSLSPTFPDRHFLPVERIHSFTDAQGRATLRGLPPGIDAGKAMVIAPGVDLLHARNASASASLGTLRAGETIKLTVSLKE